jgi:Cu/Ag efflux pump CusA
MSASSQKRSEEFLKISGQFKLGALVTESSHPVTANLSDVAKTDIAAALGLLPLAYGIGSGADMLKPLAIAVIGALCISVLLSLVATPTVYSLLRSRKPKTSE